MRLQCISNFGLFAQHLRYILQTIEQFEENILPQTHPYYQRVLRVARKLYESNQDIQLIREVNNWSVTIVDEKTQNAFVLPVS